MEAAEQRVDEPLDDLVAEPATDEVADRAVTAGREVGAPACAGQQRLESGAREAGDGHHAAGQHRPQPRRACRADSGRQTPQALRSDDPARARPRGHHVRRETE
ncbi:hypothetical protein GCM10025883_05540 [Mobilicoccus caccae]|uniref:Uncharacterized protein n=1 Tax=Mobilicoccus caccae TaxID=1859295 RepID=A0ABQ6IM55_9MICO|nr:hypothetical protein GCM10025883_05540 [Mobilicoccus caccae]